MGEIIINRVTYNSVFVTWNIQVDSGAGTLNSPSFGLHTDRHLISFSLSINTSAKITLTVLKNGSRIGRGIVFVGITNSTTGSNMRMYLNEAWQRECLFDEITTVPKGWFMSLKIDCKITWLGFIDDISNAEQPPSLLSIEHVPFNNTVFSDFTIIAEGQEIPSHKVILARYSPVFLTMFETPMKESKENKVTIEDIEYSTMKILLKIIFNGETEDLNEIDTALKVFQAAVKYEMSMIKILCEYKLQQKIQRDNVLMLLAEADKYNAARLCETCVAYIFAAKNDKITEEFKKISQKPNISLAVMNLFMDQFFSIPSQQNKRFIVVRREYVIE